LFNPEVILMQTPTRPAERIPFRLSKLTERWSCSRMSVWRQRQDPRFPKIFTIGATPYVWLSDLTAYEEALAAGGSGGVNA
jgi:predicted DNA-binding transcriptional regulator AlpA